MRMFIQQRHHSSLNFYVSLAAVEVRSAAQPCVPGQCQYCKPPVCTTKNDTILGDFNIKALHDGGLLDLVFTHKMFLINPIVLFKRRWKTTNIPSICNKFKCADQCHFSVTLVEGSFIFEKFNEYLIATQIHSN